MRRFKPPEGVSGGFIGSFVGSMIEWRESGTKLSHAEYIGGEIDKAMSPSPSPKPVPLREAEAAKRKVRRGQGRRRTILAGRLPSEQGRMLV